MKRVRGADIRPRKRRSDIGKKRKNYTGESCKHRPKNYYKKFKGNKTHIKIWIWKIDKMSYDGYQRLPTKSRNRMSHQIWIPQNSNHVYLVPVEEINNKEKLGEFVSSRYYDGTWAVMCFTHKKNKYHCSPKCKAIIVIGENDDGNYVKNFKDRGFYRYWFWNK